MNIDLRLVRWLFLAMFLLPFPLLIVAFRSWQVQSQVEWFALALLTVLYALTLHFLLVWPQTSLLLRPIMWVLVAVTLASGWRLLHLPRGSMVPWTAFLLGFTLLVLLPAVLHAWQGQKEPAGVMALGPVLTGGTFYVEEGGSHANLNYHMKYRPLRYAVDFIGVGRLGRHAQGLFPSDPARYAIYGAEVLSPLDAVVETAIDGLPDTPGPHTDPHHPAGNHIVLRLASNQDIRIALAHLKQGSVRVQAGQHVQAGQVIAQVGHSGNSTEPHLHLGVVKGDPWTGQGLPFTLEGRFPVRGRLYRGATISHSAATAASSRIKVLK